MKTQQHSHRRLFGLIVILACLVISCDLASGVSEELIPAGPESSPTLIPATAMPLPQLTLPPEATLPPAEVLESPIPRLTQPPEFDKWSLWVGETQLRGANIYQRRVFMEIDGPEFIGPGPFGPPYNQEDFNRLAEMGANYVNLSVAGVYTVEPPYEIDQEAVENLDRLLEMAAEARLFAVITFRSGPGRSEFSILGAADWVPPGHMIESVWEDPVAQAAWAAMWRYTAERYMGNPVVVGYDLMCEPNSNGILDIWDPAEFYDRYYDGHDWNTWYPAIVDAIRNVDADTPILVSSMSFGDIEWLPYLQTVEDERIVYTFHQYSPHEYTHQEAGGRLNSYPGKFDTNYDGSLEVFDLPWLQDLLSIAIDWMAENNRPLAVTNTAWCAGFPAQRITCGTK